jgi:hypothetical protein
MSLMDFVTGPASLSIHDPVSLLGARFLGRGKQQKKIDTLGVLPSIESISCTA